MKVDAFLIQDIKVVNGAIPLTRTEPEQLWIDEWAVQLYVKVRANSHHGWGEVLPSGGSTRQPYAALLERLSQALVGKDESDIEDNWNLMRRLTFSGGYGITTGAISGIDIALWDLKGRKLRKSLAELLGGKESHVDRYASLSRYATVEQAVKAVGWVLDKGYQKMKIHQAGRESLETIRLIRKNYGYGFELAADLNCTFDFGKAKKFMEGVLRYEPLWIEEPVWPPDDFDSLKKLNKIGPVAAGENAFSFFEFKRLMEMDALAVYQPDVAKVGGITPALEIVKLAKKFKVKLAFHNRPDNGWVGTIASAHLVSGMLPEGLIESPPNDIPTEYFSFNGAMDARSISPSGPGLGIEPLPTIPTSTESKMLKFHEK